MKKEMIKFIPWFIGFCDAESSFISNLVPRKNKDGLITSYRIFYRIQIGLSIKDKAILELINSKLNNIGKIYNYTSRKETTLCFISLDSMKYLIENVFSIAIDNVNNPFLTEYQANKYYILATGILKKKTGVKNIKEYELFKKTIEKVIPNFDIVSQFFLDY
jgi:hypothetical protein